MFNVAGGVQLSVDLFGGLVTEEPPENLPQGASPDNQDVVYKPGAVGARPPLRKVLASPFGSVTVTYGKSFVAPDGTIYNLYLDSLGNLWNEAGFAPPVIIGTVTPGSYALSATAFGREYIAISDGYHGSDVPLQFDGTNLDRVTQDGPGIAPTIANTFLSPSQLIDMGLTRATNVVTATTTGAHGLKVGYQVQISGVQPQPIGFISSIVINNEETPGLATVTMASPHGLSPGLFVTIQGVPPTQITTNATASRTSGVLNITYSIVGTQNVGVGSSITLSGYTSTNEGLNGTYIVASVAQAGSITVNVPGETDIATPVSGGTMVLNWPISGDQNTLYWEVQEIISPTVFQVPINYADGTWNSGTPGVFLPWDGTFFVQGVPSPTTFTYASQGPDGNSPSMSPASGTVTPQGQAGPGTHLMQVLFLTRQGYITQPSPYLKFIADGGAYLTVSDIPIGPPNVVARILAFTGTDGSQFFYIPTPAQINGQQVSTATQINDNTTTSVVLDFSDTTLFAATGINIPGNDLPNQIVIDGALGFGFYESRLVTWGQRNCITNLLNLGFDGGSCSREGVTGWTGTGTLVTGHFSVGVQNPNLSQSFYLDYLGDQIGLPNTQYTARAWVKGSITITISSASSSPAFSSSVTLTDSSSPAVGSWQQGNFSQKMPATIPADMVITVTGTGTIDNLSIIYTQFPYLDNQMLGSYVNNPEAFDGVSGVFGANDDTQQVVGAQIIRNSLYFITRDPGGRVHVITGNNTSEPVGWTANEVASNCGSLSAFGITRSQADSGTAAGGEEWMVWPSVSGGRLFSGDQPWNITMEILPDWRNINPSASATIWAMNDPIGRKIYFGLPTGQATAPNLVYPVDYKNLDTAYEIAQSPPIHVTFTGKLAARDHARKWTRWNLALNGAAMMLRGPGLLCPIFFAGNGSFPNSVAGGYGNVYKLGCGNLVDDDYGTFAPYYTTYFFTVPDIEMALQLGGQRKLLQYLQYDMIGSGYNNLTVFVDNLTNAWPITAKIIIRNPSNYDDEWGGGQASGQRFAIQFAPTAS